MPYAYRFFLFLLLPSLLLTTGRSHAQQLPTQLDSAVTVVPVLAAPATTAPDVIVRTNGEELAGRVLSITPALVRYVPAAPAPPDTASLAAADVFMVRYANGTKELIRAGADAAAESPLVGLNAEQRYLRGRQDSRQYYQPAQGVFWGTFAATVATTGYGGIVTGGVISLTPPQRQNLLAPQPQLLDDPDYYRGYRKQAQNRKLGKAAAGFGVGVAAEVALLAVVVGILFATWH